MLIMDSFLQLLKLAAIMVMNTSILISTIKNVVSHLVARLEILWILLQELCNFGGHFKPLTIAMVIFAMTSYCKMLWLAW